MNKRLVAVVAFALVVAFGAVALVYALLTRQMNRAPKPVATAQVLVAARNLGVGTLIAETDLTEVPWAGAPPPGAILDKKDAKGRGVVASIYQGEPILDVRLASVGAGAGLAAMIPPGMRAVAIRVTDITSVAGFVTPGQHVDVLITGTPPGGSGTNGSLSKTLLQNVQVLSAGQKLEKDPEGKPISVPVVNLLVSPEDSETLSLASTETKIQLILRNPLDTERAKTKGTAVRTLFTGVRVADEEQEKPRRVQPVAPPKVKPTPSPVTVEVIQGNTRNSVKFTEESR
jgi:pilus assembly protein CpaB